MEMNNLFPTEIIMEIISRLPVESVLECRRVCKIWKTLTYQPSFALLQLRRSFQAPNLDDDADDDDDVDHKYQNHSFLAVSKVGFIFLVGLQLYYGEYCDDDDDDKSSSSLSSSSSSYKTLRKINLPGIISTCQSDLVGSCNGLICLTVSKHGLDDPIYICNPITKEYIHLPTLAETYVWGWIASGFGYNPKTNEYKVVRIFYDKSHNCFGLVSQVQVFTLGSRSGWRNVKGEVKSLPHFCTNGLSANGALYWLDTEKIVAFDLDDEEFHFLPLPPNCCSRYVLLLGGLLCAATDFVKEGCQRVKVWSLKKTKNSSNSWSWSWSLEFSIEREGMYPPRLFFEYQLFALTKHGEVLLMWHDTNGLSRYNLKTDSFENLFFEEPRIENLVVCALHDPGTPDPDFRFLPIPHMNSFISLKDFGEDVKIVGSCTGFESSQRNEVRMAGENQVPSVDLFHDYYMKADLDQDGLINSVEQVIFFSGFDLPPLVLDQILEAADLDRKFSLGRDEFYNALKLVSVVQSGRELTLDVVNEIRHGRDSADIPAPKMVNPAAYVAAVETTPRRCYCRSCFQSCNCRRCFNL